MWPSGVVMAGSREIEADQAWILALCAPDRLRPGAINYNLIQGYRGDPVVTEWRTEVVIEEGVPFFLSLSSPGAPSAGTILVLARGCGAHCLTVSIYA
ncbi:hypothetical protein CgunFtcFv8_015681 [Champsocephalus gunnari]|uniref:Uncharacterized protein n=1 Tax=Champsocephalus gunnari TaxID=52237 RepID=A0AAN8C9D4_CHAGU|nr:hypothetical protein CgunFtcFv8_015681 [Champsocephalus gunnari]